MVLVVQRLERATRLKYHFRYRYFSLMAILHTKQLSREISKMLVFYLHYYSCGAMKIESAI